MAAPAKPHTPKQAREVTKADKRRHKADRKAVRETNKSMLPRVGKVANATLPRVGK
jgi:hypothetical protein